MHKKKKRSSRKAMQNRRMFKYILSQTVNSRFSGAQQVQPKAKSVGHTASMKRSAGRGE